MRSPFATLQELTIPMGATTGTPSVYIGARIPAELTAYYAPDPVVEAIVYRQGTGAYYFNAFVVPAHADPYISVGVHAFNVSDAPFTRETYRVVLGAGSGGNTGLVVGSQGSGAGSPGAGAAGSLTYLEVVSGASLFVDSGAAYTIDGVSAPRGVLPGGYVSSTGTAGPVGTSFTPVLSQSSTGLPITFRAGRVYAVHVGGGGLSTSLTTNVMEVRVNWFPGGVQTSMFDSGAFGPEIGSPSRQNVYNVNYFGFTSTVTPTDVVVYAKASAGTVTWYGDYSGNNRGPRFLMIEDKGAVASFPGVTMLN